MEAATTMIVVGETTGGCQYMTTISENNLKLRTFKYIGFKLKDKFKIH